MNKTKSSSVNQPPLILLYHPILLYHIQCEPTMRDGYYGSGSLRELVGCGGMELGEGRVKEGEGGS